MLCITKHNVLRLVQYCSWAFWNSFIVRYLCGTSIKISSHSPHIIFVQNILWRHRSCRTIFNKHHVLSVRIYPFLKFRSNTRVCRRQYCFSNSRKLPHVIARKVMDGKASGSFAWRCKLYTLLLKAQMIQELQQDVIVIGTWTLLHTMRNWRTFIFVSNSVQQCHIFSWWPACVYIISTAGVLLLKNSAGWCPAPSLTNRDF